jgi:hypothetical protein
MGVMLRATCDSVLAVGTLHQIFDASNNNGALVDSILDGAMRVRFSSPAPLHRPWAEPHSRAKAIRNHHDKKSGWLYGP